MNYEAFFGLALTFLSCFGGLAWKLGKIETKLDTLTDEVTILRTKIENK